MREKLHFIHKIQSDFTLITPIRSPSTHPEEWQAVLCSVHACHPKPGVSTKILTASWRRTVLWVGRAHRRCQDSMHWSYMVPLWLHATCRRSVCHYFSRLNFHPSIPIVHIKQLWTHVSPIKSGRAGLQVGHQPMGLLVSCDLTSLTTLTFYWKRQRWGERGETDFDWRIRCNHRTLLCPILIPEFLKSTNLCLCSSGPWIRKTPGFLAPLPASTWGINTSSKPRSKRLCFEESGRKKNAPKHRVTKALRIRRRINFSESLKVALWCGKEGGPRFRGGILRPDRGSRAGVVIA